MRVGGSWIFAVALIPFRCLMLCRSIIAEPPDGAKQVAAQLPNDIRFSWPCIPPQLAYRRLDAAAHKGFEDSPIFRGDDPVQEGERIQQHRPDVLISLALEMLGELEVFRKCRKPSDCGGPGVTDKGEPFDGRQTIEALIE